MLWPLGWFLSKEISSPGPELGPGELTESGDEPDDWPGGACTRYSECRSTGERMSVF